MTIRNPNQNYNLREARPEDAELLFEWANDELVREMAINTKKIIWLEHKAWFKQKLASAATKIFILEQNSVPVGQIRYDFINGEWLIDYSISKSERGKGLGQKIIELSLPDFKNCKLKALVKKNNIASNEVFSKLKFVLQDTEKINQVEFNCYTLTG